MSKAIVYLAAGIGGLLGSFVGSKLDRGNLFGMWGVLLSVLGGLAGIYIAYRLSD